MSNGQWRGVIQDASGQVVEGAVITVTDPDTSTPLELFTDIDGAISLDNPFSTPSTGRCEFCARAGRVNIGASFGGDSYELDNEVIFSEKGEAHTCSCGVVDAVIADLYVYNSTTSIFTHTGINGVYVVIGISERRPDMGEDAPPIDAVIGVGAPHSESAVVHDVGYSYAEPFNEDNEDGDYFIVAAVIENPGDYVNFFWHSGASSGSLQMRSIQTMFVDKVQLGDCLIEQMIAATGQGELTLDATLIGVDCDKSFACFAIFSPIFGMSTPDVTGWDYAVTAGGASDTPSVGYTNNFKTQTSQIVTIGVGSGTITGAMIVLRTATESAPVDTIPWLTPDYWDGPVTGGGGIWNADTLSWEITQDASYIPQTNSEISGVVGWNDGFRPISVTIGYDNQMTTDDPDSVDIHVTFLNDSDSYEIGTGYFLGDTIGVGNSLEIPLTFDHDANISRMQWRVSGVTGGIFNINSIDFVDGGGAGSDTVVITSAQVGEYLGWRGDFGDGETGSISPDRFLFTTDMSEGAALAGIYNFEGEFGLELHFEMQHASNPFAIAWKGLDLVSLYIVELGVTLTQPDIFYVGDGAWMVDVNAPALISAGDYTIQITMNLRQADDGIQYTGFMEERGYMIADSLGTTIGYSDSSIGGADDVGYAGAHAKLFTTWGYSIPWAFYYVTDENKLYVRLPATNPRTGDDWAPSDLFEFYYTGGATADLSGPGGDGSEEMTYEGGGVWSISDHALPNFAQYDFYISINI